MTRRKTDVVVVGAGMMGASAAWRLSQRGARVVLLEQFAVGHERGSSHGASRIFRLAYDVADYARLAQRALLTWREVERALGEDLVWTTGGLDIGPPHRLQPVADALSAAGVPFDRLTAARLWHRFPAFVVPEGWEALYQAETGVLRADACHRGLVKLALAAGAEIQENTRATHLHPASGGVHVETTSGRWEAETVVVAAAGWSNQLLDPLGLGVPMRVTREHVSYYRYRGPERIVPFIWHEDNSVHEFYGLPNASMDEAKIGEHGAGPEVDPASESVVDPAYLERAHQFVRDHVPALEPAPHAIETCLYASTPDDDFVLDRSGPIVLGIGFGGHGFKFGATIGEMLADLVEGKPIPFQSRFRHARFGVSARSG